MISTGVLLLLATLGVPNYSRNGLKARENKLRADLALIREAMDRACADTGVYPMPDTLTSATPPASGWLPTGMGVGWGMQPIQPNSWRGPYLKRLPVNDPAFTANAESGMQVNGWCWNSHREGAVPSGYAIGAPSRNISTNGTAYNTW